MAFAFQNSKLLEELRTCYEDEKGRKGLGDIECVKRYGEKGFKRDSASLIGRGKREVYGSEDDNKESLSPFQSCTFGYGNPCRRSFHPSKETITGTEEERWVQRIEVLQPPAGPQLTPNQCLGSI